QRVASAYLIRSNRTAGLFEPTTEPARATVPPTPDLAEMIGDYQGREQIAEGEAFDTAPAAIEARISRAELKSGIKTALLPKKTRGETVNLRLTLRYGNLDALKGKAVAGEYLPAMMLRGTESMTRQDINDAFDRYRAKVSFSGDPGTVTVSLQTLRGNLLPVLEIVRDALRHPVFPEDELELLKEAQLASAEQRLTDPTAIASNVVQKKISVYEPDDPRYIAGLSEEIERIRSVSAEQIRSLYRELLNSSNGEMSIVGDFDPQEVQPVLESIAADWTSNVSYERIAKIPVNNERGDFETINTPDKANATYFAAMTLPLKDDHPDNPALTLGNHILGGGALSSRLGNRVRQDEGLSYTVQSAFQASSVDERSVFYIFAICNPGNADKLKTVIREELDRLLKDGITEEELQEQKAGLLQSLELQRTRDNSLASLLGSHLQTGRTMQYSADYEDRLRALTVEDVNTALRKHIAPDRLYVVIAGDLNAAKGE
ncbi:MAG: insulinase family protein, partial [Planctomycetaceae bacterium]|nr:insulinase family protein [Planctomycetaceae bacterium]